MNKEEIKQEPNDGLIARILGGTSGLFSLYSFITTFCYYINDMIMH